MTCFSFSLCLKCSHVLKGCSGKVFHGRPSVSRAALCSRAVQGGDERAALVRGAAARHVQLLMSTI